LPELSTFEVFSPEDFQAWWAPTWKQGEHVLVLGQTGSGKTVLERFLLTPRRWVIALDAKAGDSSLDAWGYERVAKWPLSYQMRDDLREGRPVHVIVGKRAKTAQDFDVNSGLLARVVRDLWGMGRWTVVCDELQLLADKRFAGGAVGNDLEKMLIAARDRKISVVGTFQRPAIGRNTPAASASITQSTYVFVSRTRDKRVWARVAEITGRPVPETAGLIQNLEKYYFACYSLDPNEPIRIFKPPAPKKVKTGADGAVQQQSSFSRMIWGELAPEAA
jgi:hypothetical protein